jgi:hypothetical protein
VYNCPDWEAWLYLPGKGHSPVKALFAPPFEVRCEVLLRSTDITCTAPM